MSHCSRLTLLCLLPQLHDLQERRSLLQATEDALARAKAAEDAGAKPAYASAAAHVGGRVVPPQAVHSKGDSSGAGEGGFTIRPAPPSHVVAQAAAPLPALAAPLPAAAAPVPAAAAPPQAAVPPTSAPVAVQAVHVEESATRAASGGPGGLGGAGSTGGAGGERADEWAEGEWQVVWHDGSLHERRFALESAAQVRGPGGNAAALRAARRPMHAAGCR